MKKQFKYAARIGLTQRLTAFGICAVINAVFGVLGALNVYGIAWKTAGVVFSSLSLSAIVIVSAIAGVMSYMSVYLAPTAYAVLLAPVPRWKILLSRIITIVAFDTVSWCLGLAGIVWQSILLDGVSEKLKTVSIAATANDVLEFIGILIGYAFIITLVFFGGAAEKCLFKSRKCGKILQIGVALAALYLLSLSQLILGIFAPVSRKGLFFTVYIGYGLNLPTFAFLTLGLIEIAALTAVSARLIERRINI